MFRSALIVLLCSCAAQQVKPTPADQPTGKVIPESDGSNEELARAWDREEAKNVAAPQRPPPEPAPVDRTLGFKEAVSNAQSALKKRQLDEARTFAASAVKEAANLDGDARLQAGQLAFKVELTAGELDAAADVVEAWLASCGPEKAEVCRNAAIASLTHLSRKEKKLTRRAKELADDESCANKAGSAAKPQPCEGVALLRANKHDDAWRAQKLLLARANREKDDNRIVASFEKAEGACREARCSSLRRKALTKLLAHARSKNDVDGAATYALREVAVINENLTDAQKRWQRTTTLEQTCAAYDKAHGVGTCRALEKKTLGYWTFRDWSRDSAGTGLTSEHVRAVNEHFAPLLQECLSEQAKRMTPPDAARFDVRWVVFNDGRVGEAHLRRDLDDSLLAKCLRAQFNGWRYPRYDGEFQNVEQSFTVTANERRYR